MPDKHKQYAEWDTERFISWAQQVGPYTTAAVKATFAGYRVEQQGYRASMEVLADRYSLIRLEAACERAFSYTPSPSYKHISTILKSGQDTISAEPQSKEIQSTDNLTQRHGFTRGAAYYGRK